MGGECFGSGDVFGVLVGELVLGEVVDLVFMLFFF